MIKLEKYISFIKTLEHKNKKKSTTTFKLKLDLYHLINNHPFEGDILEIGCDEGNTTAALSSIASSINKNVIGCDIDDKRIKKAKIRCGEFSNCKIIKQDAYKEPWNFKNIGFVFIDANHNEKFIESDLLNSFRITNNKGLIVVHDYGLVNKNGESAKFLIERSNIFYVKQFLGEKNGWNKLGSGKVIDWEAACVGIDKS